MVAYRTYFFLIATDTRRQYYSACYLSLVTGYLPVYSFTARFAQDAKDAELIFISFSGERPESEKQQSFGEDLFNIIFKRL